MFLIQLLKIINISKNKSVFLFPGVHNSFPTVSWLCCFSVSFCSFFISNCQLAIFLVSGSLFTFIFLSLFLSIIFKFNLRSFGISKAAYDFEYKFSNDTRKLFSVSYMDFHSQNSRGLKKYFLIQFSRIRLVLSKKGLI